MLKRQIKLAGLIFSIILLIFSLSWAKDKQDSLQIKGSDTMVNLAQAWAEYFMQKNPAVFIAVTGGGSGTGIASLITGTCDIAISSREMKEKEINLAHSKGIEPTEFIVGMDGLAVVVNPNNPVDKLSIEQLKDIFTGKLTNWKEVGGKDGKIVLLSREVNSGTHVYFKEHILRQGEFSNSALLLPSSQAIADEIAQNPDAIGYYGMGYISPQQKALMVQATEGQDFFAPTLENVVLDKYPISRPLFLYTKGKPEGLVKEFVDFVLSDEGQGIVLRIDFVPMRKIEPR